MADQKIDENVKVMFTSSMNPDNQNQPNFEINRFFNELPVRILNSHEMPFFYAEDVCGILGIKNSRKAVENFDDTEIVSREQRERYGIVTYRKYKGGYRRDNTRILLTEFGVYRLLMNTRTQHSDRFKKFVYDVLHELRTRGEYKIQGELEALKITNEENLRRVGQLESSNRQLLERQSQFKNLCQKLYLIEVPINPYERVPTLPPNIVKTITELRTRGGHRSHWPRPPRQNSIGDPYAFVMADERLLAHVNAAGGFENTSSIDNLNDMAAAHGRNNDRALQVIAQYRSTAYILTGEPALFLTDSTVVHAVWVRDVKVVCLAISNTLPNIYMNYIPQEIAPGICIYVGNRDEIIAAMWAIPD